MQERDNFELYRMIDSYRKKGMYDPRDIAKNLTKELNDWPYEDIYKRVVLIINNEDEIDNNII